MHDIADLDARGVVGVFLASSEFAEAVHAQTVALGVPTPVVFVPHPIQDRTDEEMRALADGAFDAVVAALVTGPADRPPLTG